MKREDQLLSQIDGSYVTFDHDSKSTGSIGRTGKASLAEASKDTFDSNEAISDAFEKHLPDPSVLVEPANLRRCDSRG